MKNRCLLLLYCMFLPVLAGYTQPYYFKHLKVENGLSNNSVFCSLKDRHGFMWFGTRDGLCRYDGYNFKVYRHDATDSFSIGNNFIHSIYEDRQGLIWVGTGYGLFSFNSIEEKFRLVASTDNTYIKGMQQDKKGNLWFIQGQTLRKLRLSDQSIYTFDPDKYFNTASLCITDMDELYVASADGFINKYEPATNSFTRQDVFSHSRQPPSKWIQKIIHCGGGKFLIGTSNQGLKEFDAASGTYSDLLTYNTDETEIIVRDILPSGPHEYWIATESGIFIYDTEAGTFHNLRKNNHDPFSLNDNAVYTLCADNQQGIWAGTYFGGVNYYSLQFSRFHKYYPVENKNSIHGSIIGNICKDERGNIWIGTEDAGLNKFNFREERFESFSPEGQQNNIAYSNIHGLLPYRNELWVGTFERGLDVLNIQTGKIIRRYNTNTPHARLDNNFIVCIARSVNDTIVLGTAYGLYKYLESENRFERFNNIPLDLVSVICRASNGKLWIGTEKNGIYEYDPRTGLASPFPSGEPTAFFSKYRINDIMQDSKGQLWISSDGGPVCKYRTDGRLLKTYGVNDGLPCNFVFKIIEDRNNNIWLTTSNGLLFLNPATNNTKLYTKSSGLLSNQFNYDSGFMDKNGNIFVGSTNGLMVFSPDELMKSSPGAPIFITDLQVHNRELAPNQVNSPLQAAVPFTNSLTLTYDNSTISIDFAALSFPESDEIVYRYKMEGLSDSWVTLKEKRKAYFTELAPGKYIFRVTYSTGNDNWNNKEASLTIIILPPWWATGTAYTIYFLAFMALVAFAIIIVRRKAAARHKRRVELLQQKKEREIYQAKIDFFTNIAHEIKTPLTLIKAPLEDLMELSGDQKDIIRKLMIMEKNTDRLLNLTGQLLDFRQVEKNSFSLYFTQTDITELVHTNFISFKNIADKRRLDYQLQLPDEKITGYVDAEAINKILSNLIGNAVKYASKHIRISLDRHPGPESMISVEIESDGELIPDEMKERIFEPFFRIPSRENRTGAGIGLALAKALAEMHDGRIFLKSNNSDLNIFVFEIPDKKNDKKPA